MVSFANSYFSFLLKMLTGQYNYKTYDLMLGKYTYGYEFKTKPVLRTNKKMTVAILLFNKLGSKLTKKNARNDRIKSMRIIEVICQERLNSKRKG